jgi:Mn2+/Fe2+ NRAMP family transporter
MVFNIGNIAGCGLGFSVMFDMDVTTGAMISAAFAIILFLVKDAGKAMDWFAKILGFVMIGLTLYVAFVSHPPLAEALHKSFIPDTIDFTSIVTIVGGTVGGYITFSGAHRLLDAGINGSDKQPQVTRSAVTAIGLASLMRILLFLAALGVVMQGLTLNPQNPAASVFELAVGNIGLRLFGIVIWAAAVTSVVGASFTSVSFAQSFHPFITQKKNFFIIVFIIVAALLFALFGKPVKVLIFAGAFNGFILAFSLGIMLIAIAQKRIARNYKHSTLLWIAGIIVALMMLVFGSMTMYNDLNKLF